MKLHLLDRSSSKNSSITAKRNSYPYFLKIWHYHPELELVLSIKSTGTRFIGDSIEPFNEGDLVLIGKNLPHMWLNDAIYFEKSSELIAEAIAVHFRKNFFGNGIDNIPELEPIGELFNRARHGIKFLNISKKIKAKVKTVLNKNGLERMVELIQLLHILAKYPNYELLASNGYVNSVYEIEDKNMDEIYAYIFKNFKNPISLSTIAQIAHMNPSSFSRFFKRVNRKTFSRYLNEIRIGYACKLLLDQKLHVTAICYESGFNNISNFNRQFRIIKNMSPTEYLNYHKG